MIYMYTSLHWQINIGVLHSNLQVLPVSDRQNKKKPRGLRTSPSEYRGTILLFCNISVRLYMHKRWKNFCQKMIKIVLTGRGVTYCYELLHHKLLWIFWIDIYSRKKLSWQFIIISIFKFEIIAYIWETVVLEH